MDTTKRSVVARAWNRVGRIGRAQRLFLNFYYYFFGLFAFSRAAPAACGGSQARGLIQAAASGLRHGHSNAGSEPRLRPTPQLSATPDP